MSSEKIDSLNIKNIIFDFGGVLYDIDFSRSVKELEKLGVADFDNLLTKAKQHHLFDLIDVGKITPEFFRDEFRALVNKNLSNRQVDYIWNALLLGYKDESMKLLPIIRKNYKIFLLSNSNQIHYDYYSPLLQQYGYSSFDELFDKAYFSHEIHFRKPNPESFRFVIDEQHILPEETLFIDDLLPNIEGAEKVGLQACYLDLEKGESIVSLFDDNGLLK